jgi:hypothetical protein
VSSTWHSVTTYGAVGDGVTDDSVAVQAAFDACIDGGVVEFPAGRTYCVSTFIVCHANTTVQAYGATIKSIHASRGVFRNFYGDDEYAEYAGESNIAILGGTWDGNAYSLGKGGVVTGTTNIMSFIHCSDITVRDATFRDTSGAHALEFNAVDGARVENCRFGGFADNTIDQSRVTSEALQIDIAKTGSSSIGLFDGTPCKDISVRNCWFGPSDRLGSFGRAVGSHSIVAGQFYDRITVADCEIIGGYDVGVLASYWRDSSISGLKVRDSGSYGIRAEYSPGLRVSDNHVLSPGSGGVLTLESDRVLVSGNYVVSAQSNGINLAGCDGGIVSGNVINATASNHGITCGASASAGGDILVADNTVYDQASAGVRVTSPRCTVRGNLVRGGASGVSVAASGVSVVGNDLRHNGWSATAALPVPPGTVLSFTGATVLPGDNLI